MDDDKVTAQMNYTQHSMNASQLPLSGTSKLDPDVLDRSALLFSKALLRHLLPKGGSSRWPVFAGPNLVPTTEGRVQIGGSNVTRLSSKHSSMNCRYAIAGSHRHRLFCDTSSEFGQTCLFARSTPFYTTESQADDASSGQPSRLSVVRDDCVGQKL